uniref:glycosyltransferase family 4 protein n=1 Tax=uncultured Erythrobacter sp. TaxID=263913 RepID=UPI00260FCAD4|nr:glycosyltransferase family 4 protein [uncultured Erythrobacter sp.]
MGGVTRALTLFEQPALASIGHSQVVPIDPSARFAPSIRANLIVDHMALSWKRLAFLASLRARNPRARIIHVEHSYTRSFEANQVASHGRFRTMIKLAALMVDQFVCVSHGQREWLADDVGVSKEKLRVIYPWSGRFALDSVPAALPREDRPLRLLAYGRFAEIKNFAELIIAMRSFSTDQVELTLFGDGPDREWLSKLAAPLSHVQFDGPTDDIGKYLAACDAVIVPSRNEAFGLVATEARLAGRAIIVADVDGLPEQVGSAGLAASMIGAKDIDAAIRWALHAPLADMGAAGRVEVASQHDEIVARWLEQFEKSA